MMSPDVLHLSPPLGSPLHTSFIFLAVTLNDPYMVATTPDFRPHSFLDLSLQKLKHVFPGRVYKTALILILIEPASVTRLASNQ